MDQLHAMEIFVEVARLRSFSEAGRQLGLTRAMVSKHVIQLEELLQARLLHRSTREVEPDRCRPGLPGAVHGDRGAGAGGGRVVAQAGAELAGPLRIQAPSSFGSEWLADAVARFCLRHPLLEPRCSSTTRCSIRSRTAST